MPHELASRLVAAVASQDQSALAECFATDVEFRALTPPASGNVLVPVKRRR